MSARDEPGKAREYETILILRPDLMDDGVASINKKVHSIIDKNGGKLLKVESWGKRKLAFKLKKQQKGFYYHWHFLGGPAVVGELQRQLRVMDTVLRQYTIKIDENIDPEAKPGDVDEKVLDPSLGKAAEEAKSAEGAEAAEEPKEAEKATGEAGEGEKAEPEQKAKAEEKGGEESAGEASEKKEKTEEEKPSSSDEKSDE
jgi:small subunit ribosomal protein S6